MPWVLPTANLDSATVGKYFGYGVLVVLGALFIWIRVRLAAQKLKAATPTQLALGVLLAVALFWGRIAMRQSLTTATASLEPTRALVATTLPSAARTVAAATQPSAPAALVTQTPSPAPATGVDSKALARALSDARQHAPLPPIKSSAVAGLADEYVSEAAGYALRLPTGWNCQAYAKGDPWVLDAGSATDGMISVGFSAFPEDMDAHELHTDSIRKHISQQPNTHFLSQNTSVIHGRRALWFKYTGPVQTNSGSVKMMVVHYLIPLQNGRIAEIRVAAPPEKFDHIAPLLRKSVATFRLLDK